MKEHGNIKHGGTGTKAYLLWRSIIRRCHGMGKKEYPSYKGRGIVMYEPWRNNFKLFEDYVTSLPGWGILGLTLDRIDNEGNYEPGNLRWVNMSIQRINSRSLRGNETGQRNIRSGYKGKYRVSIVRGGKRYYLGNNFRSLEEAIEARDKFLKTH